MDPVHSFPLSIRPLSVLLSDYEITSLLAFAFSTIAAGTSSRGLGLPDHKNFESLTYEPKIDIISTYFFVPRFATVIRSWLTSIREKT